MPSRPIEVLNSHQASHYKQLENQRLHHAQNQISKGFQTRINDQHQKPQEMSKSDDPEYRYDAKEKGNNSYYSSNKKKKDKKEQENKKSKDNPMEKPKGGGFDMLI